MKASALLLVLPLFLGSCCGGETTLNPRDTEREVSEAIMGMYAGFQNRNLEKVGTYMTEDSTCYDATTSTLLRGRKAVLDHFGAILGEHKAGETWQSSIEGITVHSEGQLAYATYQVRTSAGAMHAIAAVTHVFRYSGERWLAIHLHRSWNAPGK
jgi:ketosteroid isomerase-like protein